MSTTWWVGARQIDVAQSNNLVPASIDPDEAIMAAVPRDQKVCDWGNDPDLHLAQTQSVPFQRLELLSQFGIIPNFVPHIGRHRWNRQQLRKTLLPFGPPWCILWIWHSQPT